MSSTSTDRTEEFFQQATEQYQQLEKGTSELANEIPTLSPDEILDRCSQLQEMQEKIAEKDANLIELMKFHGSSILDMPYLGEYQRALDGAIRASDKVSQKAHAQKAILTAELKSLQIGRTGVSVYKSTTVETRNQTRGTI